MEWIPTDEKILDMDLLDSSNWPYWIRLAQICGIRLWKVAHVTIVVNVHIGHVHLFIIIELSIFVKLVVPVVEVFH